MRANGFKEIKDGDCRYLVRIPSGWVPKRDSAEANRPLLFVHGLGIGIPQYATLVSYLAKAKTLKDRPIAILIQPHISMSFFAKNYLNPPNEQTSCAGIERMAKRWGFDKSGLTVLSHSNGTVSLVDLPPRRNSLTLSLEDCTWMVAQESSRTSPAFLLR